LASLGLIGEVRLEYGLIFGRERRLLPLSPTLGLIVSRLTGKPWDNEPAPLALQVGVIGDILGLRSAI
jgi:hypothetical protein